MQSTIPLRNGRTGRVTVKSGCRTCKIRKVKCDEGRPFCRRCVSTGRVCDGYGVWGGGGNFYGQQNRPDPSKSRATLPRPSYIPFLVASTDDKERFDWFRCRTAVKVPGSYGLGAWGSFLLQASLSEPAVLHAVLALSSAHRGASFDDSSQEQRYLALNKLEQITLQHYDKAISHLQPHFLAKGRASSRIALITCIVFISLDLLRGHIKSALMHVANGLKLLEEMQWLSDINDGVLLLSPCHEPIDDWIVELLFRLHTHVQLFKQPYHLPSLLLRAAEQSHSKASFCSFKEAWNVMDRLLNIILHLTEKSRDHETDYFSSCRPPALLELQQHVRMELVQWLDTYNVSRKTLLGQGLGQEAKICQLLCIHHTMVTIMAETCLHTYDEGVFDSWTDLFVHLIRQLVDMTLISFDDVPPRRMSGQRIGMSESVVDVGWLAPLYFTATKCRIHRIRLQAVRLLGTSFHREGIWDSMITARVSQKVMELEERDYYKEMDTADDFPLLSYPKPQDLSLPTLPESYRIRGVEVALCGEPVDKVLLFCRQRKDGTDCKVRIGEYHLQSQRWVL